MDTPTQETPVEGGSDVQEEHQEAAPEVDGGADEAPADPDAASRAAFFDGVELSDEESHLEASEETESEEQKPEVEEEQQEEAKTELDIKWNLDKLEVPHKFKPKVEALLKTVAADAKTQASKLTEGYAASNAAFANAFVDIIRSDDPVGKLAEYAKAFPDGALPKDALQNLEKRVTKPSKDQPQEVIAPLNERVSKAIDEIEGHYWPLLEKTEDPALARKLWSEMNRRVQGVRDAAMSAQIKAVLLGFHEKLIKPKFDEFGKLQTDAQQREAQAERTVKVQMWQKASTALKEKYKDEHATIWPKVKQLLKTRYKPALESVNASGKGHLELANDLFLLVRGNQKPAKVPGRPGLRPQGAHVRSTENIESMSEEKAHEHIKNKYWMS